MLDGKLSVGFTIATSGLLARPPRSCDRLDDDHITAVVVHRRSGELVPLVVVPGQLS